ncbi:MAG: sulfatase-like hydrolase/transferase [Alphaproteobacteria bacterium]|nr:sulfatase-like hydrolase/transferase [Alphaproteobacteria bacterium]
MRRAIVLALAGIAAAALAAPGPAPGVILVVVDTLRQDALTPYGAPSEASPFLSELADRGVVWSEHGANSSWTKSAYASLLTGQLPSSHGLYAPEDALAASATTLAEMLPEVDSAAILGNPLAGTRHGLTQGFDHVVEPPDAEHLPDAEALVDAALSWLAERDEAPFLLVLMPFEPHAPYAPPARWRQQLCPACGPGTLDAPEREYAGPGPGPEAVARMRALYAGEVRAVDEALARLRGGVAGLGLEGRTTWIVTADHGEAFGEHGVFGHAFHLWEEVLAVPLLISGPGAPRGRRVGQVSSHLDLAPTVLGLLGTEGPPLPGQALLRNGRVVELSEDRTRLSEVNLYGIRRLAVRDARRKIVAHAPLDEATFRRYYGDREPYPSAARGRPRWEAYDLASDPGERLDLGEAAARQDPLAAMAEQALQRW